MNVLELLAGSPDGLALSAIAAIGEMPLSATHRLLVELVRLGYVRQLGGQGEYVLTNKLVSLGLQFLSASGIVEIAQPSLDALAEISHELVRLAVVDGDELVFVAKAQGAKRGLRYDPDMGLSVRLSCSAAGHAWLSTLDEDAVLALVTKQGLGEPKDYGPRAPTSISALRNCLRITRRRGYAMISDMFAPAMASIAAPVVYQGTALGVVTIAGPSVRMSEERMVALSDALRRTSEELAGLGHSSALFRKRAAA